MAQYDFGWNRQNPNVGFLLQGDHGGAYISALQDSSLTFDLTKMVSPNMNSVKFGINFHDSYLNIIDTRSFDMTLGMLPVVQELTAGSIVSFWMEGLNNANSIDGTNYYGSLLIDNPGGSGSVFNMKFHMDNMSWGDWWDTIVSARGGPAGQPLPGIIATFAATAAIFGAYMGMRRRKR